MRIKKSISIFVITILLVFFSSIGTAQFVDYHAYVDPDGNEINIDEMAEDRKELFRQIKEDYDKVKEINPDIVGWIHYPEQTYQPIFYSGDNEKYLRHDMNGNWDKEGELFMSKASEGTFSDMSLIYGHNMGSGAKFGRLKLLRGYENFKKMQEMVIYDGQFFHTYRAFSTFYHIDGTQLFEQKGLTGETRKDYLKDIYKRSRHQLDNIDDVDFEQDVVFLQTCLIAVGLERDVVAAILVDSVSVNEIQ